MQNSMQMNTVKTEEISIFPGFESLFIFCSPKLTNLIRIKENFIQMFKYSNALLTKKNEMLRL